MAWIETDSLRVFYRQSGSGPDLVLVSGLAVDHRIWDVAAFEDAFRVTVFDNRGAGLTGVPPGPCTMETLAADVARLCGALGIRRACFAGHSMGGHILQYLAVREPALCGPMVIACSEPRFSVISDLATRQHVALQECGAPAELVARDYLPVLFSRGFLEDRARVESYVAKVLGSRPAITPEGYRLQLEALRAHDSRALLPRIATPVLVLGCREDLLTPWENSEALAAAIPGAKLQCIEGCGHMPFIERPQEFYNAMNGFLRSQVG